MKKYPTLEFWATSKQIACWLYLDGHPCNFRKFESLEGHYKRRGEYYTYAKSTGQANNVDEFFKAD